LSQANLSYVLADVHLQPDSQHPINQLFHQFLTNLAPQAQEIYILGDLFESWVGDDIGLKIYANEINALKSLADQGTKIYITYGNRDFLMREAFEEASGAILIKQDIIDRQIQTTNFLLLHGDTLCTDDQSYQKMRRWFHRVWVQWLFLKLPKKTRLNIANAMRQKSKQQTANKHTTIMDVNPQAVESLYQQHPTIAHIIHGHTHRPAQHTTKLSFKNKTRWVLGDWQPKHATLIKIENGQPTLFSFTG